MKHRIPISFFFAISSITGMAQSETTDSIKTQALDEIVVEASSQRINAEVSTYIPMTRQKNAAQNAVSLLSMMSIPQISVDPASQAVQTAHGQNVSIFIRHRRRFVRNENSGREKSRVFHAPLRCPFPRCKIFQIH